MVAGAAVTVAGAAIIERACNNYSFDQGEMYRAGEEAKSNKKELKHLEEKYLERELKKPPVYTRFFDNNKHRGLGNGEDSERRK